MLEDHEEDECNPDCPFCGSQDGCVHVFLVVDKTFRTAEGGVLMDAFNNRWCALCEAGGDDFDEDEPFDNLLEEVNSLADTAIDRDDEGGPGMSSAYVTYYVKSETEAPDALARFLGFMANREQDEAQTVTKTPPSGWPRYSRRDSVFVGDPEKIEKLMEDLRKRFAPGGADFKPTPPPRQSHPR